MRDGRRFVRRPANDVDGVWLHRSSSCAPRYSGSTLGPATRSSLAWLPTGSSESCVRARRDTSCGALQGTSGQSEFSRACGRRPTRGNSRSVMDVLGRSSARRILTFVCTSLTRLHLCVRIPSRRQNPKGVCCLLQMGVKTGQHRRMRSRSAALPADSHRAQA